MNDRTQRIPFASSLFLLAILALPGTAAAELCCDRPTLTCVDIPTCASPNIPGYCIADDACGRASCDVTAIVAIQDLLLVKSAANRDDVAALWTLDDNADSYDAWWVGAKADIPTATGSTGLSPQRQSSIDQNLDVSAVLGLGGDARFYQVEGLCSGPPAVGACCSSTAGCVNDQEKSICETGGGTFAGPGSLCADNPCQRLVFATSETYTAVLGGVSGGDAKCQNLANLAGLVGTYKAWLGSFAESPANTFTRSSFPYELVTGGLVALDWNDLVDGTLISPINTDEMGSPAGGRTWTGAEPDGTHFAADCGAWQSSASFGLTGDTGAITGGWTEGLGVGCLDMNRLYCFQQ